MNASDYVTEVALAVERGYQDRIRAIFDEPPMTHEEWAEWNSPAAKEARRKEAEARRTAAQAAKAQALKEEGEMWLSIYAPDQVYDPKVHYKPEPECECGCCDY